MIRKISTSLQKKWAYVLKSRYVWRGKICHSAQDIVSYLISVSDRSEGRVPIIAASDDVAAILDDNNDSLESLYYLPNAKPSGSLSEKMSKEYMSELAIKVGLNVPRTWQVEDGIIPDGIEYPCITKADRKSVV